MARRTGITGAEVFRVIIRRGYGTEALGPYSTLAAAKGIVTAATNPLWGDSTAHIERAVTTWEKVTV